MFELETKYEENVKIYAETIENEAISQIVQIANSPLGENAHIRIMPDAHAGKGCVIGTTMQVTDKVCPNIVGVDIGCGMLAIQIPEITDSQIEALDKWLGLFANKDSGVYCDAFDEIWYDHLLCRGALKHLSYLRFTQGTLGGGNHFVEIAKGEDTGYWLIIHSGSRNLGKQVAEYYQKKAEKVYEQDYLQKRKDCIAKLKAEGRDKEIEQALLSIKKEEYAPTGLEYLTGQDMEDYLHDMKLCQEWAGVSRKILGCYALFALDVPEEDVKIYLETIHNYIDETNMVRKGAVAAHKNQMLLIPLNMRDGSLLCKGKGNPDWNESAPHGAGRLMSRSEAKEKISLAEFKDSMIGIKSSTICQSTIDEAPAAYKSADEIVSAIEDTVEIIDVLTPIYNFKATK